MLVVLVGVGASVNAEIYKWQDEAGITYYSNHPPKHPVRHLDTIPGHSLSSEQTTPSPLYYSAAPEQNNTEKFTVPPEVLQELLYKDVVKVAVSKPSAPDFSNMTALTMRLAELENTLQREIKNRLGLEYQHTQARSIINALQQQNYTLHTSLKRMQKDLEQVRGTVVASDIQVAALKQWGPFQQLAMLADQVSGLEGHLNTLTTEIDDLKTVSLQSVQQEASVDSETRDLLTRVMSDNHVLEAVIKRQAAELKAQNQQIASIEARLAGLQDTEPNVEPVVPQPRGGIRIVARIERRRTSLAGRFLSWVMTPQERLLEEK
jgi:hypothetical protein